MKKAQEHSRTGIRVRHFEQKNLSNSDFTLINEVTVLDSLVEDPTPVLGRSSRSRSKTPRKKIFEGYTRSPRRAHVENVQEIQQVQEGARKIEELKVEVVKRTEVIQDTQITPKVQVMEVVAIHKAGQPIILPNPLNIAQPVRSKLDVTTVQAQVQQQIPPQLNSSNKQITQIQSQSKHVTVAEEVKPQIIQVPGSAPVAVQPQPQVQPQPHSIARRLNSASSHFVPLQNFLKLPTKDREQILERMNPANRQHSSYTSSNEPYCPVSPNPNHETLELRRQVETLSKRLLQKQQSQQTAIRLMQQFQQSRDLELQKKQSEISCHVIKIEELSKLVETKNKEIELLRFQLKRRKPSEDTEDTSCEGRFAGNYQFRKLKSQQFQGFKDFDQSDQARQLLSPLSVNMSNDRIDQLNSFRCNNKTWI